VLIIRLRLRFKFYIAFDGLATFSFVTLIPSRIASVDVEENSNFHQPSLGDPFAAT
jgi:hypothetical protein